jgi:glutamate racemase
MQNNNAPIGVFDSGIGGLTVVREIQRVLPFESIVYLGDTARVPYGIRSPQTVIRYSLECTRFLLSKKIKLLVVACNTAAAVGIDRIRETVSVPVIGVIAPGAKAAAMNTKNKKIGIIGTEATIKSSSYLKAIKSFDESIEVFSCPCPLFVPLVEEGWLDGDVPRLTASRYLGHVKDMGIDTLVLGCTHYPLLKKVISEVMGSGVTLIDSAVETAKEVKYELQSKGIEGIASDAPVREFYVTDSPERFKSIGERFLGQRIENINKIELGV